MRRERTPWPGATRTRILVSARTGEGLDGLRDRLFEVAASRLVAVDVLVPYARGDAVSIIYAAGRDVVQTAESDGSRLRALLPAADAARLADVLATAPTGPDHEGSRPAASNEPST